jgi:glycosyltransferase 2 family protein
MPESVLVGEQQSVRRRVLTFGVYAAAAAGLAWVLYGLNWGEFQQDLKDIEWKWVWLAVALDILSYVCQAWRWNYVLKPLGAPSLLRTTQAIYAGLFVNEILPLRSGELVRAYLVSHWTRLGFSVVLSSVAVERLIDGIWLAVGFGITAWNIHLRRVIRDGAQVLAILVLGGVVLLVLVLAGGLRVTHALERTRAAQRRWLAGILHFIDRLFEGLQAIGHSASLYWAVGTSLVLLLTQILALWAMMRGFGLEYSFWVGATVLFILHLGTAIPNAPANLGSYQVSCVTGLMLFGADKTTAAEFSLVMFVILTVPLLVLGLAALLLSGHSIQDMRRAAQEHRRRYRAAQDAASPQG